MFLLLSTDAVYRRSGRGWSAAHRRGEVAPSGWGECTEHPEGGQSHVQRCGAVRWRPLLSITMKHFLFLLSSDFKSYLSRSRFSFLLQFSLNDEMSVEVQRPSGYESDTCRSPSRPSSCQLWEQLLYANTHSVYISTECCSVFIKYFLNSRVFPFCSLSV